MRTPRKLSPASNGAAYPTLKDARRRRLLLAGVGAASLAVGVGCFPFAVQGEAPIPALDASVEIDGGEALAADAGTEGGDS